MVSWWAVMVCTTLETSPLCLQLENVDIQVVAWLRGGGLRIQQSWLANKCSKHVRACVCAYAIVCCTCVSVRGGRVYVSCTSLQVWHTRTVGLMRRPRSAFSKLLNATHRDNRILHSIVCGGLGVGHVVVLACSLWLNNQLSWCFCVIVLFSCVIVCDSRLLLVLLYWHTHSSATVLAHTHWCYCIGTHTLVRARCMRWYVWRAYSELLFVWLILNTAQSLPLSQVGDLYLTCLLFASCCWHSIVTIVLCALCTTDECVMCT